MVKHEGEVQAQPQVGTATDCATARLGGVEIGADVVIAAGADIRVGGLEPEFRTGFLPGQLLTCIAAVDFLAPLGER